MTCKLLMKVGDENQREHALTGTRDSPPKHWLCLKGSVFKCRLNSDIMKADATLYRSKQWLFCCFNHFGIYSPKKDNKIIQPKTIKRNGTFLSAFTTPQNIRHSRKGSSAFQFSRTFISSCLKYLSSAQPGSNKSQGESTIIYMEKNLCVCTFRCMAV